METRRLKTTTTGLARKVVCSSGRSSSGGSTVLKLRRITDDAVEVLFLYIWVLVFLRAQELCDREVDLGSLSHSLSHSSTIPNKLYSLCVDIKHHERRKKVHFAWRLPERFADPK